MHTRHCASVLVNMVSPDSPTSPNNGQGTMIPFLPMRKGAHRGLVTHQGVAELRWQPSSAGLQRPCYSCCHSLPCSAFLRLLQANLCCTPPPPPGVPKPPHSLSPLCQVHPSLSLARWLSWQAAFLSSIHH